MALRGIRVIELAGLAPAPFCGMILSDFGANVIRVDKPGAGAFEDTLSRGKRSVVVNLRNPEGAQVFKKLAKTADVLIEPFRAGVMEKLNLGPSVLCAENPRLVYARLTGFGQNGPFSKMAGHDINYIAVSGILSIFGPHGQKPSFPVNLLADFAGGGLMCALGICLALFDRVRTGKGQVIDANMVDGSAYLGSWLWTTRNENTLPLWDFERGKNLLDGGAPFYQTYETKDGKYMAVGALEPQFYAQLLEGLGLDVDEYAQMGDWEKTTKVFSKVFASKTQEEWCNIFDFKDACVTPVVSLQKAHSHHHNMTSKSFYSDGKNHFPRPAPNLSSCPGVPSLMKPKNAEHTEEVLLEVGYTKSEISSLKTVGAVEASKTKSSL